MVGDVQIIRFRYIVFKSLHHQEYSHTFFLLIIIMNYKWNPEPYTHQLSLINTDYGCFRLCKA